MLASHVKQGYKPYNEDAVYTETIQKHNHTAYLLMVADGHGKNGEGAECAAYCITQGHRQTLDLPDEYRTWTIDQWQHHIDRDCDALHDGYRTVCGSKPHRHIDGRGIVRNNDNGSPIHSGSTFTRVLVFPVEGVEGGFRTVITQLGDSDVFVNGECVSEDDSALQSDHFHRIQETIPENDRLLLVYHTKDRTINPWNYPRIYLPDGTKNQDYVLDPWNNGLHPDCAKYTPATYFVSQSDQQDFVYLGVGSTIGDFYAHPQGITNRCKVKIITSVKMPHIMVASDGAWDTLDQDNRWSTPTKGDCGGIIWKDATLTQQDCNTLVTKHVELLYDIANELFGKHAVDDISVAVLIPKVESGLS